jgi:hypothetical protein
MLPSLDKPKFTCILPSDKREVKFVPFTVKQEKILLMAIESKTMSSIIDAIIDVVNQCVISDDINVDKLPYFDIEYLMLQIRSKSVSEIVSVSLKHRDDSECKHSTKIDVNISNINIDPKQISDGIFNVDQRYKMKFNYPSVHDINKIYHDQQQETDVQKFIDLIVKSLQCVFTDDEVFDTFDYNEAYDFIMQLSKQQFDQVVEFITNRPQLEASITYNCEKCKQEETVVVRGIENFFTL